MSFLDRIIDGAQGLFYNQKRSVSFGSRVVAVVVAFLTLVTIFPTLAEDLLPAPNVVEVASPEPSVGTTLLNQPEPSATQSQEPSPEPTTSPSSGQSPFPVVPAPELSSSPSPTPSSTSESKDNEKEKKITVAKNQPRISFRFPISVAIDPRATLATLPEVALTGGMVGMLCISSDAIIDIGEKNFADRVNKGAALVSGDLSPNIRISGSLGAINYAINSGGGLRAIAAQGRLPNAGIFLSYVELTGIDLNPEFCGKAENHRSVTFRELGLQMDTVKTRLDFNKPSGK